MPALASVTAFATGRPLGADELSAAPIRYPRPSRLAAPLDDQTVHALVSGDIELELSEGCQPSYWWLLCAE